MPPFIAFLLVCALVVGLLVVDLRRRPRLSAAMWIPTIWLAVLASRPLTSWLNPTGSLSLNVEDGSPVDRIILSGLMLVGAFILARRRLPWSRWLGANRWLAVFFLYCGLSVLWSDFPLVALKRWIRAIGSIEMILVVLSESNAVAAAEALVRRCGFILVPFSVLTVKYYRALSVAYNPWTGEEYLVGVTTDKNALGRLCLVSGVFILWDLLHRRDQEHDHTFSTRAASAAGLIMTLWLLQKSKSATSLGTFVLCATLMLVLSVPVIKKHVVPFMIAALAGVVILASTVDFAQIFVNRLGRDMTFTDRTYVWSDLLAMNTNPLVGVGYDSFWIGDRLEYFVRKHQVNEAHDGYLEVYLELGLVGLLLLGLVLMSTFWNARRGLMAGIKYSTLQLVTLFMFPRVQHHRGGVQGDNPDVLRPLAALSTDGRRRPLRRWR